MVIYLHFNRRASKAGKPWTVHAAGKCTTVSYVRIEKPSETVWKPKAKANPRGFLRVWGQVRFEGASAIIY